MKHFYGEVNYSSGREAYEEHSGKFEDAYLGDIGNEVTRWPTGSNIGTTDQ